jgi:hypothetical protein
LRKQIRAWFHFAFIGGAVARLVYALTQVARSLATSPKVGVRPGTR